MPVVILPYFPRVSSFMILYEAVLMLENLIGWSVMFWTGVCVMSMKIAQVVMGAGILIAVALASSAILMSIGFYLWDASIKRSARRMAKQRGREVAMKWMLSKYDHPRSGTLLKPDFLRVADCLGLPTVTQETGREKTVYQLTRDIDTYFGIRGVEE